MIPHLRLIEIVIAVAVLFVILVALASCASTWTRPGASAADYEHDKAECEYESVKATGNNNSMVGSAVREIEIENTCMRAMGWRKQ